jgi:hypothetical protein
MTWVREPDLRALVKKYIGEYEASYIPFGFEPISSWAYVLVQANDVV